MFTSFALAEEQVRGHRMTVFRDRPRSLGELLDASLRWGERDYIVDGDRRITYAGHHAAAIRVADWLATHGVGPGDRVAILGRNSIEWVVAFWATVSLGAVAVPLNAWWADAEIQWALDHCRPALLIDDMAVVAREAGSGTAATTSPRPQVDEDDPAVILYTSGTTGRPKGATHSHRNVIGLCQAQQWLAASRTPPGVALPPPRVLTSTPLFHVSGLHSGVVANLTAGGTTVWQPGRFDPEATMALIERERPTSWTTMPTTLWRVVTHPRRSGYDLTSIRHVGGGGSAWSPALQQRIRETFGDTVTWGVGYGLTECTGLATSAGYAELLDDPTTVGTPVATVEVRIDGATDPGTEGEICIRGPMVMLGYWGDPAATAEVIDADGWLHSGDLGSIDPAGRLRLAARRTDLILRGAENVYPTEVENCLEGHPDIDEVAVVGLPDEEYGQVVAAVVVPRPDAAERFDPDAVAAWARQRLGHYKVPSRWFVWSSPLPRTATGKVVREHVLRRLPESAVASKERA